jgi:hypothetical protein
VISAAGVRAGDTPARRPDRRVVVGERGDNMINTVLKIDGAAIDAPDQVGYVHVGLPAESAEHGAHALHRCQHCGATLRKDTARRFVDDSGSTECERDPDRQTNCPDDSPDCDDSCDTGTHLPEPAPLAWARYAVVDLLDDEDGISFQVEFADLPGSITLTLWRSPDGVDMRLEAPPDPLRDGYLVVEQGKTQDQFHVRAR